MKKWITQSVGLLMSGFLFGQTENTQEKGTTDERL